MTRKLKNRRKHSRLELLEARQLLTFAPVATPDSFSVLEDGELSSLSSSETLIDTGAEWLYLDDGSDQGDAWREFIFDDEEWGIGNAQLGYGDGDEATELSFGPDENDKFPTTYFRHHFNVAPGLEITGLTLSLLRDDGAAIYLNGEEIIRDNVPVSANFDDYALSTTQNEAGFTPFVVNPNLLRDGENVLAVEIHQADPSSSDISLDLSLVASVGQAGVLANDTDADGDLLTANLISPPEHGALTFNSDGTFVYVPAVNYHGPDSFTYRASDGALESDETTVSIEVQDVNDIPVAVGEQFHGLVDTMLSISVARGVLQNDYDFDGEPLVAVLQTDVVHGSLTLQQDGSFTYLPAASYVGQDSFVYVASDGRDSSEPTVVRLVVTATNDPPVVEDDNYTILEDAVLTITLASIPQPTLAYFADFSGPVPPEFGGATSLASVEGFDGYGNGDNVFSGSFLRNDANPVANGVPAPPTILTLTDLPPHDSIDVGFLLALLDDWDGSGGGFSGGPDSLNVTVDGNLIFSETFDSENTPSGQTYFAPPDGELLLNQNVWNQDNNWESGYDMSLEPSLRNIPHSSPSLTVEWFGSGNGYRRLRGFGGRDGETFAIDNVSIVLRQGEVVNTTEVELVAAGANWSYLDDASDQGVAWRELGFDDSSWAAGPAELGYGDGDEATIVNSGPAGNFYATTYFRHVFQASQVNSLSGLRLNLLRDDGAAVYLNGEEVVRDNVAPNAQFNDYAQTTTQSESTFFAFSLPPELLVEGQNVLAVEVHQANGQSSDLSFDLSLNGTISESASGNLGVLFNDHDPDGGPLQAELVSSTQHGTLEFNPNGTFTYTPDPNYYGPDSFVYRASDVFDAATEGTAFITVTPGPNERPLVLRKSYETSEDSPLVVSAAQGLLVGATDEDLDPLTALLAKAPIHGAVNIGADGSFQYMPNANYFGEDSFSYVANDSLQNSLPADVTLTISPLPDAPRATGEQYFGEPGVSLDIDVQSGVLANDTDADRDAITAVLVDDVANGVLTLRPDGSFTYVADVGFHATDSFTYQASDGTSLSSPATVLLTVDARPVAVNDSYTLSEDSPLSVNAAQGVLSNDIDAEGDPLTAAIVGQPTRGTVTLSADGSFLYTPRQDYFGQDAFTYRINDGDQDSTNTGTVNLTINAVNDAPVAVADLYSVVQDGELTVSAAEGVLANDIDVDSSGLTVQLVAGTDPAHGQLQLAADGSFTYVPELGYIGTDSFAYLTYDGTLVSELSVVSLVVTDPNLAVVITEIMYHPASENDAEEYIEILNAGLGTVDLTGWRITKGVDFTFPTVILGAGEYAVVAADMAVFTATYGAIPGPLVGGWEGRLSNNGEEIEIETSFGDRVDRVQYADGGDWALRRRGPNDGGSQGWVWIAEHDGEGRSLELISPEAPNNRGQNWASSLVVNGTPGAQNSVYRRIIAPLIDNVKHSPAVPRPNEPVTITVDLTDGGDGLQYADVFYRVARVNPNFQSIRMFNDGLHGDGEAGDDRWGVVLPGQPNGTIVEFYVRATDDEAFSRTWPAPTDAQGTQGANALYQVDAETYDGGQPIYRLVLTATEEQELQNINRQSDAQMNATFINVDGTGYDVRYLVGVRIRGSGSRGRTPPNYRVNIPSDTPWQGVDAINLNTQYPHGQMLGMTLFELARLPQEDATIVQVRQNGVQRATTAAQQGSHVRLEVPNSQWAENHFPLDSTGNVYTGSNNRLDYLGENPNQYRNGLSKQTNESQDDWTDFIALARALDRNQTPDNVFQQTLEAVADVDQWMRFLAINALLVNEENGLINGNGDDWSLYCGVNDPRCLLMVHDLDTIFAEGDGDAGTARITRDLFEPRATPAFNRILDVPEYLSLYYWHLRDLANTVFAPAQLFPLMDNLLGGWVAPNILQDMKDFAGARRDWVLTQIPQNLAIPPVATVSGEPPAVTPVGSATLSVGGEGVVQYRYRMNGGAFSQATPVDTPLQLSGLTDGQYTIEVIGINSAGAAQPTEEATLSKTWTVSSAYSDLIINEVLASNDAALNHQGTFPDAIELFNRGATTIDLTGMTLTDDLDSPNRFTFPAETSLGAGEYLVLYADNANGTEGIHLGFSLSETGEGVYLFDSVDDGGALLDQVEFGLQLSDLSIGRNENFQFVLSQPTLGQANIAQPMGNPSALRINEWLADARRFRRDDFFELYNPDPLPAALGGMFLTDTPLGWPNHHEIDPLSFIAGSGYQVFIADDNEGAGADHVNFNINANRDSIALFDQHLKQVDQVVVMPQTTDISQGRSPDGANSFAYFGLPTPGAANIDYPMAVRLINGLRVTEIMYNPPGPAEDEEFLELQNVSDLPLDLTGVRIGGGISFVFPAMMLQPNQFVVVVNDLAAFQALHGAERNVAGEFSGNLDNGGEEIFVRLPVPLDIDIQRFDYNDSPSSNWPTEPDGEGSSLTIIDTEGDYNDGLNWKASTTLNGTPGLAEGDFISVNNLRINVGLTDPADLPVGAQPNSWMTQRSDLRSIELTFSSAVVLSVADLRLINLGVDAPNDPDVVIPLVADQLTVNGNVATITFGVDELPEGVYRLDVLPTVTGQLDQPLDGNRDGVSGDAYSAVGNDQNKLYRLLADWNSDGGVSIFDFPAFAYWFATAPPAAPEYMDLNRDGGITIFDFPIFAARFAHSITFPAAPLVAPSGLTPSSALLLNEPTDLPAEGEKSTRAAAQFAAREDARRRVFYEWNRASSSASRVEQTDRAGHRQIALEEVLDDIGADVLDGWAGATDVQV